MKKRKVTAVLLAAMMCMQIIAGCGTKNDAAQTESSVAATEDAQGAAGENTQTAGQNATEENVGGMAEKKASQEKMPQNRKTAQKAQFLRMANIRWKSH